VLSGSLTTIPASSHHPLFIAPPIPSQHNAGTIGFGNPGGSTSEKEREAEFGSLQVMADTAVDYGCRASFEHVSLNSSALGLAMSVLTSTMTSTKTEMTAVGGSRQRTVRPGVREQKSAHLYKEDETSVAVDKDKWHGALGSWWSS
jgi:hypothetical protein